MSQAWALILSGTALLLMGQRGTVPQGHSPAPKSSCTGCHTMTSHHTSWEKGSHAKVATCVDCHLPPGPSIRRTQAMAADGLRHAAIEGLNPAPDTLQIRGAGAKVVQASCLRCHPHRPPSPTDDPSKPKPAPMTSAHADVNQSCAQCHRETSHPR